MRKTIFLNDRWEFTELWDNSFATGEGAQDGTSFAVVRLPHTCKETPFHYFDESVYQMCCGYRRELYAPEEWDGRMVILTVEAAGHRAEVWLNGEKLAEHNCGYTAFSVELTGLRPGEKNLLAICVDSRETLNIPPFGYVIDYMTYGGLYREVRLDVTEKEYIEDVFVRPEIPEKRGLLRRNAGHAQAAERLPQIRFDGIVKSELAIRGETEGLTVHQTVFCSRCGKRVPEEPDLQEEQSVPEEPGLQEEQSMPEPGRKGQNGVLAEKSYDLANLPRAERGDSDSSVPAVIAELELPGAVLWDVLQPQLYTLRTELLRGEEVLDVRETVFGFRRAEFKADGFYLNGRKLKLAGLNRHQSYPYVGYAMPESQQKRDADILKYELGLNAVRTSHYPQSQHFVDRCDEIGLLVFTEIPGWQHIGDDAWKDQAVQNTRDMVLQYRNHPSIFLWGVRINESKDDDELYRRTNAAVHELDDTRPTGGVRCHKNSHLLEDVYTYNDFLHDGTNAGCEPKRKVTSDKDKAYMVTEYNGHMFPTKSFDSEVHRRDHALRHARVLNDIAGQQDIAGSFGWCFFDYNTHQDFGSGDRICYHGVTDMFRNPKPAAAVYASLQEDIPVLEVSSAMDIGEHPTGNLGRIFAFTNAEQILVYKNGRLIKTYEVASKSYPDLKHPPVEIDDFVGDILEKEEGFSPLQANLVRDLLNYAASYGFSHLSPKIMAKAAVLMQRYHMTFEDAYRLYGKYIGDWGGTATSWRFEAVRGGEVVKTVVKEPVKEIRLRAEADHTDLRDGRTYDVASVRLTMRDQNGNVLPFYQGAVGLRTEGPVQIIGPALAQLRGGMGGTYVKTTGDAGDALLILTDEQGEEIRIPFRVSRKDPPDPDPAVGTEPGSTGRSKQDAQGFGLEDVC